MTATEQLVTVADLARRANVHPRTMRRRLERMHSRRPPKPEDEWLVRSNGKETGKFKILLSRLRKAHPEFFEAKYATRDELGELRGFVHGMNQRLNATRARVRTLWLDRRAARGETETGQNGTGPDNRGPL